MTNQQSVSSNTRLHVHYCYFMETMTSVFYARIDKICTFTQLLLGSAVMADVINLSLVGLIIAVVSAYQFTCNPAITAYKAKQQSICYAEVIHDLPNSTDSDINAKLKTLEEKDSAILHSIRRASYIQASVATGKTGTAEEDFKKLTPIRRFIIFIAGGIHK